MRRIFIDDRVKEVAQYYKNHLLEKHTRRDFIKPKDGLLAFAEEIRRGRANCVLWSYYADYAEKLGKHFDEVLMIRPAMFDRWYHRYFDRLNKQMLTDKNWRNRRGDMSFCEHIVKIMHYSTVRSEDMVACLKKLGIKTCVYCNAQYTNTVEISEDGTVKGRYELDHFWPKDEYPFLCISFFNLQPSCASCNKWKRDMHSHFNLYTENYHELDPFAFELTSASIVRYMLTQNLDVLGVKLRCRDAGLRDNHIELFHTEDLYKTYVDELEELIWKYKSFNDAFKIQLLDRFKKLFPQHATRNEIIRFLYNFYSNPKDVHKRPLTKLKQDVANQLKMI